MIMRAGNEITAPSCKIAAITLVHSAPGRRSRHCQKALCPRRISLITLSLLSYFSLCKCLCNGASAGENFNYAAKDNTWFNKNVFNILFTSLKEFRIPLLWKLFFTTLKTLIWRYTDLNQQTPSSHKIQQGMCFLQICTCSLEWFPQI
jgi:hypothetical protein